MFDMTRETLIALGAPADVRLAVGADDVGLSLEARMAGHDWYYWSDRNENNRQQGEDARKRIVSELKGLPIEDALALWRKYAPEGFSFPVEQ